MKEVLSASLIAVLFPITVHSAHAETIGRLTLETGLEYYTGKYGSSHPTDIMSIPVTCKVQNKDWTVKMTIPYLEITGASNVVDRFGQTTGTATHSHTVRAGMGDLLVATSHNVLDGGTGELSIKLTGKVKFATADSSKGLSTGKNDYAIESTLFKPSNSITTFGTLGYKKYGSPATYKLNDVFFASMGGSYKFSPDTSGGAMFFAGQRIMDGRENRAEVLFFVNHTLSRKWKTQGYLLKGFSQSVPSWGGGVLIDYIFELKQQQTTTGFVLRGSDEA
jgi:hypothetical protein